MALIYFDAIFISSLPKSSSYNNLFSYKSVEVKERHFLVVAKDRSQALEVEEHHFLVVAKSSVMEFGFSFLTPNIHYNEPGPKC